jgi:hypothetical protein
MTEAEKMEEAVAVLRHMRANRAGTNNAAIAGERRALDTVIEALTAWNTRPSVVPAELAELSARATHGEWVAENGGGRGSWIGNTSRARDWAALSCGNSDQEAEANAAFIVAAVNYLRALLSASTVEG